MKILISGTIQPLVEETTTSFPSLLAWCSRDTNNIDVENYETGETYASFDGAHIPWAGSIENLKLDWGWYWDDI